MTTPAPVSLARRVTATAWYVGSSVMFLLFGTLVFWSLVVVFASVGESPLRAVVYALGCATTIAGVSVQLVAYYRDGRLEEAERAPLRRRVVSWQSGLTVLGAVLAAAATGSILLVAAIVATALCLVRWPRRVRLYGVLMVSVVLVALAVMLPVDFSVAAPVEAEADQVEYVAALFAAGLPSMTALSLWSWDIVTELDRARATESRLAATQERLRLAAELHDLQGHHLQVIALQLELAERMLVRDPTAAAEQIRLAQSSVDEARAGTRALAGRFRGVPLPDEFANAADLLRAAGVTVRLDVTWDAPAAPADLLGPVVRELTTNILKHGGGSWAELSLQRVGGSWRLSAANDPGDSAPPASGSGLESIGYRIGAIGGTVQHRRTPDRFEVTVTVPIGAATGKENG